MKEHVGTHFSSFYFIFIILFNVMKAELCTRIKSSKLVSLKGLAGLYYKIKFFFLYWTTGLKF